MNDPNIDKELRRQNDRMIDAGIWFLRLVIFGNLVILLLLIITG
jgi:hypothetical protein